MTIKVVRYNASHTAFITPDAEGHSYPKPTHVPPAIELEAWRRSKGPKV